MDNVMEGSHSSNVVYDFTGCEIIKFHKFYYCLYSTSSKSCYVVDVLMGFAKVVTEWKVMILGNINIIRMVKIAK